MSQCFRLIIIYLYCFQSFPNLFLSTIISIKLATQYKVALTRAPTNNILNIQITITQTIIIQYNPPSKNKLFYLRRKNKNNCIPGVEPVNKQRSVTLRRNTMSFPQVSPCPRYIHYFHIYVCSICDEKIRVYELDSKFLKYLLAYHLKFLNHHTDQHFYYKYQPSTLSTQGIILYIP